MNVARFKKSGLFVSLTNVLQNKTITKGENMKIAYLGPRGTFSEEAVRIYVTNNKIEALWEPLNSIDKVINALEKKEADMAVIPIENSVEGIVNSALDHLIGNGNGLKIIGEIVLDIHQNLIGLEGARIEKIIEFYSHPQAIAQCDRYINAMFKNSKINLTSSTAEGAQIVASLKKENCAAIGNKLLADIYGLKVLASNIHDKKNNKTRFIVLGHSSPPLIKRAKIKSSLIFEIKDEPGSLLKVLEVFDVMNINMTHISSRPSKRSLGEYVFFVEFEWRIPQNEKVKIALELLKEKTDNLKNLGSYQIIAK